MIAFAMGVWHHPDFNVKNAIGQFPDADDLLYIIYEAHADVSTSVAIRPAKAGTEQCALRRTR
ncbi:MAG: hypothetical protein ACTHMJ_15010 [Thermomicrobiales bacterium]